MSAPNWVKKEWINYWRKPWTVPLNKASAFKAACWEHGYQSPNFTRNEGRSGDGVGIPDEHRKHAQRYCFKLERVRHRLGDHPLIWIDQYRSPAHNADVGGASASEHVFACAADWGPRSNQGEFNTVMRRAFAQGGIGSGAVSGRVMHTDTGCRNGGPRRWTYSGA